MRERKYIKLRVDMYEDTKFKIIDRRPERDLIQYVWIRLLALAGKVNLEGELFLSKNIPYTIETLAIEFNREVDQIKLALDVFIELEMIELAEEKVYRVINFAKHQNIKVKEKDKSIDNKGDIKSSKVQIKEKLNTGIDYDKDIEVKANQEKELENTINQNQVENVTIHDMNNLEVINNEVNQVAADMNCDNINNCNNDKCSNDSFKDNSPILIEMKKNKKVNKKKKNDKLSHIAVEDEESSIDCFKDGISNGEIILGECERIISEWSF